MRLLSDREAIDLLTSWAANGFAEAPRGPLLVECLDAGDAVLWRGHFKDAGDLSALLRQLLDEAEIAASQAKRT